MKLFLKNNFLIHIGIPRGRLSTENYFSEQDNSIILKGEDNSGKPGRMAEEGQECDRLQKPQNRAARIIMNYKNESGQSLLARNALGWINLEERRAQMKARLMYKSINNLAPERLSNQNSSTIYNYDLRGSSTRLCLPKPKTEFLKKSFSYTMGLTSGIIFRKR